MLAFFVAVVVVVTTTTTTTAQATARVIYVALYTFFYRMRGDCFRALHPTTGFESWYRIMSRHSCCTIDGAPAAHKIKLFLRSGNTGLQRLSAKSQTFRKFAWKCTCYLAHDHHAPVPGMQFLETCPAEIFTKTTTGAWWWWWSSALARFSWNSRRLCTKICSHFVGCVKFVVLNYFVIIFTFISLLILSFCYYFCIFYFHVYKYF